jgi:hypothetical protein
MMTFIIGNGINFLTDLNRLLDNTLNTAEIQHNNFFQVYCQLRFMLSRFLETK